MTASKRDLWRRSSWRVVTPPRLVLFCTMDYLARWMSTATATDISHTPRQQYNTVDTDIVYASDCPDLKKMGLASSSRLAPIALDHNISQSTLTQNEWPMSEIAFEHHKTQKAWHLVRSLHSRSRAHAMTQWERPTALASPPLATREGPELNKIYNNNYKGR